MFSRSLFLLPSVRASETICMFPRYLRSLLMDFCQTFVTGASWDKDELIRFWGQKVKVTLSRRRRPALDAAVEFRFLVLGDFDDDSICDDS